MLSQTDVRPGHRAPMPYDEYLELGETLHHEYFDGECVVNPPSKRHVRIARRMTRLLEDAAPSDYEVLPEFGWRIRPGFDFEPDIMVARSGAPGPDLLREPPLLIVEVMSPSTRSDDLGRKMELYAEGGLPWYWVVDPAADTLAIFASDAGAFRAAGMLSATDVRTFEQPFTIRLEMPALLAD